MMSDGEGNVVIGAKKSLYSFFSRSYASYKSFDDDIQEFGSGPKKFFWAIGKSGVLISSCVGTLAFIEFLVTASKFGIDGSNIDKTKDFISGLPTGHEFFNVVNLLNVVALVMIVRAGYLFYKSLKEEQGTLQKFDEDDCLPTTPNEF